MYTVPKTRPGSDLPEQNGGTSLTAASDRSSGLAPVPKSRFKFKDSYFADGAFRSVVIACAVALVAVVGLILFELVSQSSLSMSKFGFKFLVKTVWDPVAEDFGALPF